MTTATRPAATVEQVRGVAETIAAANAHDVDREARFPAEAIDALRDLGALSLLVPARLGGGGAPLAEVAEMCLHLGRCCGATGLVFAMHQIQVACIARHSAGSTWFEGYLEDVADQQHLIASATSEAGTGGDMARSVAALAHDGDWSAFEKTSPTLSYGAHADAVLVTLRRNEEAEPGDQVAVLAERAQLSLEQTGSWDPFGMRGTCSPGFVVRGRIPPEQVLPTPFGTIAGETMVPVSHILWSHVWLGIATDAFNRAHAFVRELGRRRPGHTPEAALALSRVLSELSLLRAEVRMGLRDFCDLDDSRDDGTTLTQGLRFNSLKIASSEHAANVCRLAMGVCGIVGYMNDTPYSIGRHVRDAMSASLMIANERIHATNADRLLIAKEA